MSVYYLVVGIYMSEFKMAMTMLCNATLQFFSFNLTKIPIQLFMYLQRNSNSVFAAKEEVKINFTNFYKNTTTFYKKIWHLIRHFT